MIRTAKFDGNNTLLSAGFQQTQWFSRSDAATDDRGLPVAANIPRYGRAGWHHHTYPPECPLPCHQNPAAGF